MNDSKCAACPLAGSAGSCLGNSPTHAYFCDWAQTGDAHMRQVIVGRSAFPAPPAATIAAAEVAPAAEPKPPTAARKALNFAKAIVTHVADGMPAVAPAELERRLSICRTCPAYDACGPRCQACGCNLDIKAAWAGQGCPRGHWQAVSAPTVQA